MRAPTLPPPPRPPEFGAPGDVYAATAATLAWAEAEGIRPLVGLAPCPHGAYLFRTCPGGICAQLPIPGAGADVLDHAVWWAPLAGGFSPFLLAHAYTDDAERTLAHAESLALPHAMHVTSETPRDDWYGYGTVPLRFRLSSLAVYPLEYALAGAARTTARRENPR